MYIHKVAIFWSIGIVVIGVSIAFFGIYSSSQTITTVPALSKSNNGIYFTLQGQDSIGNIEGNVFTGGPKMTYVSVSDDGSLILATSSASDTVFAFSNHGEKISEISVGKVPKGIKIHPSKNLAFVANENSGSINVIDLSNWKIIKEIPVGEIPHNIAFHPNGITAFVTIQGGDEVAVIDVPSLTKTGSIPVGKMPHNLDITSDGKQLFVTNIGTNDVAVIDLKKNEIIKPFY